MKNPLLIALALCCIGFTQTPSVGEKTKLPKPEDLRLRTGSTLARELDSFLEMGPGRKMHRPQIDVSFSNRALFSIGYYWETMGAYPSSGRIHHVFNLSTNREVSLWEEIKPSERNAFEKLLRSRIQPLMNKHRMEYPAEDWKNAFHEEDNSEPRSIDRKFRVSGLTRFKTFYITEGTIHFVINSYWEFPHVIQALDFSCDLPIPFAELRPFLKDSSVLRF